MTPFDLRGPEFLVFYFLLAAGLLWLFYARRTNREDAGGAALPRLEDPYLIAYLRGGREAAIETAMVSLVDRKFITVENDQMVASTTRGSEHPLEKSILQEVRQARKAKEARTLSCDETMDGYQHYLTTHGLLPGADLKSARVWDTLAISVLLVVVAAVKIAIAISRGRTNIIFLLILMAVSVGAAIVLMNPRLTSRGRRAVDHLQTLLARLKGKADSLRPNQDTQELVLLAAVFGVMAVPVTAMPQRPMMYPQSTSSDGGGGDSGSSCGSSCGGGCGGGCGGCGS